MDDDFNTPQALGVLFDLVRVLNATRERATDGIGGAPAFVAGVRESGRLAGVLGLLTVPPRDRGVMDPDVEVRVEALVRLRHEARARHFAEADRLRRELTELGVVLEDKPDGTAWNIER